ncbi:DUF1835 domain-containing protein [Sphingobacterium lumbrici]|uniref:DUF1835 domain-containing protein n=1 Tax=Sphingobacterium lumbrici TaxID=2559600 RepID=UPI00112E1DBE|nr:DUF1835 domain-containing protein [Sphingobacterium lumbrici]
MGTTNTTNHIGRKMQKKDLHVTFGFAGNATLIQSQIIDIEKGEIRNFNDPLSQGPLCDLDDVEAIENRKRWLQNVFGSIQSEGGSNFIDDNLSLLRELIDTSNTYEKIYLWVGDEADEKITTARLLFHLQDLSIPIYRLNFDKMEFQNEKGVKLYPTSLQVMRVEDISEASQHFDELSAGDKQFFVSIWEHLRTDQSVVHLFNRSGKYVSGEDTFFDQYLLNHCTDKPKRSPFIVADTLFDIWEEFRGGCVGDSFLYHRLNELAHGGKIEISNRHEDPERAKVVYDVRKLN